MTDDVLMEVTEEQIALESLAHSIEKDRLVIDTGLSAIAITEESLTALTQESLTEDQFYAHVMNVESSLGMTLESHRPSCYSEGYSQEILDWTVKFIRGALVKVWEAIKNAIAAMRRKIMEFFSKLLAGNTRMQSKIQDLLKELKKLESDNLSATKNPIKVPNGGRLHIGGNIDAEELNTAINDLATDLVPVLEYYGQENNKIVDELEKATQLLERISESTVENFEQQISKIRSMPGDLQSGLSRKAKNLTRRKEYPGGQSLTLQDATYEPNGVPSKMPSLEFERTDRKVSYSETETVIPVDFEEARSLLESCQKILESVAAAEKQFKSLDKRLEKLVDQKDEVMNSAEVTSKIESLGIDNSVRVLMNFFQLALPGSIAKVVKYEYGVARATVIYCEKSIAAHKKQN